MFLCAAAWYVEHAIPRHTKITFFDVGQGDAMLIQTPALQNILIDGGPDATILWKLGTTLPFYHRTIDLLVLTHPHSDHLNGLIPVLRSFSVSQILFTDFPYHSREFNLFVQEIREKKIKTTIAHAGQVIHYATGTIAVLYPFGSVPADTTPNNSSIVLEVLDRKKVLLMGDAERIVEQTLLISPFSLRADIIKLGHHGSSTSSSELLLSSVHPTSAIISVGKNNSFGHPSPAVINRLRQRNISFFRTDQHGDITQLLD